MPALLFGMHAGALISLYTVLGGFHAVVFTDVVQAFTLLLSGILVFAQCVVRLPSGLGWALANASAAGKLSLTMDAAGAGRSAPLLNLFGLCLYVLTLCVYQDTVQRICAAASLRQARIATLILGFAALPIWVFFMLIGARRRRLAITCAACAAASARVATLYTCGRTIHATSGARRRKDRPALVVLRSAVL